VDMKNGTFGPNVKYAIMPNSAKFNSMPFKNCTGLKAVFYGRKYADTLSESTKNLAKYSGGTEDAALYYYTESTSDMASQAGPLYWRYKPGSTTTVQVMEYPGYTVSAEYDFTTLLA
ncbi:MAG: hypothetical protein VZR78_04890, partial [Candidatus Enteromonas sp.]|nr:hypothetical protein [Candidatus Enteromonas sp.]